MLIFSKIFKFGARQMHVPAKVNPGPHDIKIIKSLLGIEEKNYWILANEDKKRPRFQNNRGGSRGGSRGSYRGRKNRKDRNEEVWRKRRRPWEHSEKPKNEHKTFDDEGKANETKTKENNETVEKKAKIET